jgi:DNA transformation protein and related proteins
MTLAKPAVPANRAFADYCCELLATQGVCVAKRMFGGWGISTDGLTLAIIADLGDGEKLWLKADDQVRSRFEAAGCERFVYHGKTKTSSMGYYTAPEEAMDSADAMRQWARLALESALRARTAKPASKPRPKVVATTSAAARAKPVKPRAVKPAAQRKSSQA